MFHWLFARVQGLPRLLRKLLPTIILLVIGVVAGATNVFSDQVRNLVTTAFHERTATIMPMLVNLLVVAILFNFAYLFYHPVWCGIERMMKSSGASERVVSFTVRSVKLGYWAVASLTILSIFAPDLMGKMVLGVSVLGAAITFALQDAAKNFISGLRVQLSTKVRPGDNVKTLGSPDIDGKVIDIGYLATTVQTDAGVLTVPNTQIWERPVLQKKPEKSKIILPPGCNWPEPNSKDTK